MTGIGIPQWLRSIGLGVRLSPSAVSTCWSLDMNIDDWRPSLELNVSQSLSDKLNALRCNTEYMAKMKEREQSKEYLPLLMRKLC